VLAYARQNQHGDRSPVPLPVFSRSCAGRASWTAPAAVARILAALLRELLDRHSRLASHEPMSTAVEIGFASRQARSRADRNLWIASARCFANPARPRPQRYLMLRPAPRTEDDEDEQNFNVAVCSSPCSGQDNKPIQAQKLEVANFHVQGLAGKLPYPGAHHPAKSGRQTIPAKSTAPARKRADTNAEAARPFRSGRCPGISRRG